MTPMVWLIVIGGVFVVLGGFAYVGMWRSWARPASAQQPFAWFWSGLALVCLGTAGYCLDGPLVTVALPLMIVFVVAGALGFWMALGGAPWARPGWHRRQTGRGSR